MHKWFSPACRISADSAAIFSCHVSRWSDWIPQQDTPLAVAEWSTLCVKSDLADPNTSFPLTVAFRLNFVPGSHSPAGGKCHDDSRGRARTDRKKTGQDGV